MPRDLHVPRPPVRLHVRGAASDAGPILPPLQQPPPLPLLRTVATYLRPERLRRAVRCGARRAVPQERLQRPSGDRALSHAGDSGQRPLLSAGPRARRRDHAGAALRGGEGKRRSVRASGDGGGGATGAIGAGSRGRRGNGRFVCGGDGARGPETVIRRKCRGEEYLVFADGRNGERCVGRPK